MVRVEFQATSATTHSCDFPNDTGLGVVESPSEAVVLRGGERQIVGHRKRQAARRRRLRILIFLPLDSICQNEGLRSY